MKPIHALWVISLDYKLRNSGKVIENGFRVAAITEALDPHKDFGDEDSFKYIKCKKFRTLNFWTFYFRTLNFRTFFYPNFGRSTQML